MHTVILRLTINDEELATLKEYAATYDAKLGMTWRMVARGWAWGGLRETIASYQRRQQMTPRQLADYDSLNGSSEEE